MSYVSFQLEISGKGINMIADMIDSANVQNCGHPMESLEIDNGSVSIKCYFTTMIFNNAQLHFTVW